jgi:predicted phosphodiesterase
MSFKSSKFSTPVFKKGQPDDSFKFRPLPKPAGEYPYHLDLEKVLPAVSGEKIVFHMVGDTGSVRNPDFQKLVAAQMIRQYDVEDRPGFLYHLGDIVYNFGEAELYNRQFFEPYRHYPGPIFAIPGNHDSDVNPDNPVPYHSLDAFTEVFCGKQPHAVRFSDDIKRKGGVQPHVFWTLKTPLANIVGLYGNVTKFGVITEEQRAWFEEELKRANLERAEKALIVCIHHSAYSADINHGSSKTIIEFFQRAFEETKVKPDIVFSGHVHNYQRFHKHYEDGSMVPFIVAGAGGYDELHAIAAIDNHAFTGESPLFSNVDIQSYCDDKHGFLKITLEKTSKGLTLTGEYYTIPHEEILEADDLPAALADRFVLKLGSR